VIVAASFCSACAPRPWPDSLAEGRASDIGALGASIGALVGSVVGYQLRTGLQRRLRLPSLVLALGEDGLAFGLGRWAVRR
jgi:hypothetical protein